MWAPMLAMSVVLSVAIIWGFYVAVQNRRYTEEIARIDRERAADTAARRMELVRFLEETCVHDAERGAVVIRVLQESRARALKRGDVRTARQHQQAISDLRFVAQRCFDEVPPLTPEVP